MKHEDPDLPQDKKDQLMEWFKNICDPKFNLIGGLVATFIDNQADKDMSKKVLKILVKLNEKLPDVVCDQFYNNLKFPKALIEYLEVTKLEEMSGDAFILLISIFDEDTIPQYINKSPDFVNKLTTSLEYIQDESTLHSLISILVCLLPVYEQWSPDPSDISLNPILKEVVEKDQFYREKLIHITNRGSQYRIDNCCKTLVIILLKDDLNYFNHNDLNLLMDIALREVRTQADTKNRVQILKLIETILDNELYRENKYRIGDVEDMILEQILYEEEAVEEKQYSNYELECIASLN